MKIISQSFAKDSTSLIQLLEASITKEIILYRGAQCTVQIEPGYSAQELETLALQSLDCLVDKADLNNTNTSGLKIGLFHCMTYKLSSVDESYKMRILANNTTIKNVSMSITSTNPQNSNNVSNNALHQANTDSVIKKRKCIIQ